MNLTCSRCQYINRPDNNFCSRCGISLVTKSSNFTGLLTAGIALGVLVAVCGFCGIFGMVNSPEKQNTSEPVTLKSLDESPGQTPIPKDATKLLKELEATVSRKKISDSKIREAEEILWEIPDNTKERSKGKKLIKRARNRLASNNRAKSRKEKKKRQKKKRQKKKRRATRPRPRTSSGKYLIRGPRGGCYYINRNGNKTYVDRSMCR